MKQLIGATIALVVFLAVLAAWILRWDLVAVATNNIPMAYELDRWTGDVYTVGGGTALLQKKEGK